MRTRWSHRTALREGVCAVIHRMQAAHSLGVEAVNSCHLLTSPC